MNAKLMTHIVAFYPDEAASFDAARALADGGASFLEIQFPFSDPQADGPDIQDACSVALGSGFTVERGFEFVRRVADATGLPVFVVTYGNIPFTVGIGSFARSVKSSGAAGTIVPDLCFPEDEGLNRIGREEGIEVVPLVAATTGDGRLDAIASLKPRYLYVALRRGITGKRTAIGPETVRFLKKASLTGAGLFAGFGITDRDQVLELAPYVLASVAGSVFVRTIRFTEKSGGNVYAAVRAKIEELLN
jgi:tryptophan synthase alpha chain